MRQRATIVFGALALFLPAHALAQECPANSEPYSTESTTEGTVTHCQCIAGYVLSSGSCQPRPSPAVPQKTGGKSGPHTAYCTARARLDADKDAIAGLGFSSNASKFEDFAAHATNLRTDFIFQASDAAFGAIIDKAVMERAFEYTKSLNPWTVNTRIKELRQLSAGAGGGSTEAIEQAMRALARVRSKPAIVPYAKNAVMEAGNKLLEAVKDAEFKVKTKHEMEQAPAYIGALILAGKIATTNPWAGLVISGAEMAQTAALAYGVSQSVDRLADLNDTQMRQLVIYRKRLYKDIEALHAARRVLRRTSGSAKDPSCS